MDFIDHRSTATFQFKISATDEKARIDNSGNLLVGKSATGIGTAGAEVRGVGQLWATRDGGVPISANRLSSDGYVQTFYKAGALVGGIGTKNNTLTIGSGDTGILFNESGSAVYPWDLTANAGSDGLLDLGIATRRWKDLHIGGNANIGGNATITGDLTVNGTTTTLNTATLDVEDKNITLNYGAGDTSSTANGAGITIQDAVDASNNATILWDATNDEFDFSHAINVTGGITSTASSSTFTNTSTMDINLVANPPELNFEDTNSTSGTKRARWTLDSNNFSAQGLADNDGSVTHQLLNFNLSNGTATFGGTISSGAITSTGNITLAEYLYHNGNTGTNLRFLTDRAILTSGGGAIVDAHSNGNLYLTGTTVQVYGNYNSSGTISSGAITSSAAVVSTAVDSGNPQAATDQARLSGYGLMGNRSNLYITNANASGIIQLGVGGAHNASPALTVSANNVNTHGSTISSGAITSSGTISAQNSLTVQNSAAYGSIELGGVSGGFIDIKRPFSDDYDLRLIAEGDGGVINVASGELTIQRAGSAKLATTSTGIAVTGNATFGDNGKAIFGAGSDLQIYHSGTASFITENGTGDLRLSANNLLLRSDDAFVQSEDGTVNSARFNSATGVTLYRANAAKLSTTSTGIDVTGTVTADGLTVNSGATSTTVNFGNSGTPYATWYNDTNGVSIISADAGNTGVATRLQFNVGGVQALRIQEGGDLSLFEDTGTSPKFFWDASAESLGIGTSSPDALLEINKGSEGEYLKVGGDNVSNGRSLTFTSSASSSGSVGALHTIKSSSVAGEIAFANGNGTIMYLKDGGNVGIGEPNPVEELHISGSVPKIQIQDSDGTNQYGQFYHSAGVTSILARNGASDGTVVFQRYDGTTTDESMRIDASGNVGIGTSSPARKLEVVGAAHFGVPSSGVTLADNGGVGSVYGLNAAGTTYNPVEIRTGISGSGFYQDTSGKVGIGTSSPDSKLVISEGASATGLEINPLDANERIDIYGFDRGSNVYRDLRFIADEFRVETGTSSAAERMRIDSIGNVGIGTVPDAISSNATTLNIKGAVNTKGGAVVLESSDESLRSYFYPTSTGTQLGTLTNHDLLFMTNSTERMRIDSSGRVGIGTSSPSFKLDVAGNARASYFALRSNESAPSESSFIYRPATGVLGFGTGTAERTRIDASGNQLWGKTAADNTTQGIRFLGSSGFMSIVRSNATAIIVNRIDGDGTLMEFRTNGTTRGSISIAGTTTSYNTTSDERLKENIVDAPSASDDIDAIQVRSFNWKTDGAHQKYGMVAQELSAVAPEAVHVPEDTDEMQSVDYSKLVPMMLKEIQSLRARVAQLEGES